MPLANITQIQPFNINSSASFSFANVTATGNITGSYLIGNGSALASITGANVSGTVANATYAISAGTVTTAAQPNITSVGTLTSLTSGLITATAGGIKVGNLQDTSGTNTVQLTNSDILVTGNISAGAGGTGNVTATYFIGNGSQLTGLPASYSNANVAAYLPTYTGLVGGTLSTAAQPNITSIGTLSSLTVTNTITGGNLSTAGTLSAGDATITGNLTVNGTTVTANVSTMNVKDPIIEMGGNTSGALTSNDGKDRGTLLHYYTTTPVDAFMGWDNSAGEFAFGSNVSISSEVVTFNTLGNVRANTFIGALSGAATTAATVTTNAQPNITSVGTLTSLSVTGNLTAGNFITSGTSGNISGANNISANTFTGTLTTQAQPNITSVGTLASVSVTANASAGNILTDNLLYANGVAWAFSSYSNTNVGAYLPTYSGLVGGTLSTAAQPNITSVGTLSSLSVTANITAGNISGANAITANYFVGNGSLLTGLPASYANANVATYLPTYTGNLSPGNLVVGTSANLGAVGNVIITGGSSGQVLSTNGSGVLSWADQSGGGGNTATTPMASVQVFTADGSGNTYTLTATPVNEDQLSVNIDGVMQLHSSFTLSGNVVTLGGTPITGSKVEITNIAATAAATTGKAIAMAIVFGF